MKVKVNEKELKKLKKTKWSTADLIIGKEYDVINVSPKLGWYRITDESGEDYLYPPTIFDIVEK